MSKEKDNSEFEELNSVSDVEEIESDKPEKKRPTWLLVLLNSCISLILVASILATGVLGALAYLFKDMQLDVHFPENNEDLGISDEVVERLPEDNGIVNIALFGIDNYKKITDNSKRVKGRSDSIIILSIDSKNKTVKLTSILRDSWVPIERSSGTKNYKINTAYAYGGPTLAVKTLNQNFKLDIKDYATVSLYQLSTVIDYVGGIDLKITEKERTQINKCWIGGEPVDQVEKAGMVHLNGRQAVGFASIRYIDGDDYRAKRHQKVLTAILEAVKQKPISEYPALLSKILGQVETSMTYNEIIKYTSLVADSELQVETTLIPGSNVPHKRGIFSDTRGGWVWKYDLNVASEFIHNWIYGEENEDEDEPQNDKNGSEPQGGSDVNNTSNTNSTDSQSEGQK